jgi:hypothetical protein
MYGVDFQGIGHRQLCVWALNHPDGRLFAIGPATEGQNGLCKRIGDQEFITDRIVSDIVHRPAEQCFLSGDHALR